jgi:DNA-binding MarR family transcriptional regulator
MSQPKWLTPAEMLAWRGFITTSTDLVNLIAKDLAPYGLDGGDYQLLAMLSEAPDQKLKMCDLAERLRLSRSGLTRRIDGVLKAKYVSQVRDNQDGRVVFAHLTKKGFDLIKKVAPHHLESVRSRMIDLLSPAEIRAFGSGFEKIARNVKQSE